MGFKSLLLIVVMAFFVIFAIQNGGAIAFTFFGFKSPAFPLWMWILIALLAGIISSLIINFLSTNTIGKNERNQTFEPSYSSPPPPPPPERKQKSIPEEKSMEETKTVPEKLEYQWQEDEIFEDLPDTPIHETLEEINTTSENEFISQENSVPEEIESKPEKTISHQKSEDKENVIITQEEIKTPNNDDFPPPLLKPREASPYSYQSGEKTQIRPTRVNPPPKEKKEKSNPTPKRLYQGIYDAPYRIIAPAQDNQDEEFFEDDEDWEF